MDNPESPPTPAARTGRMAALSALAVMGVVLLLALLLALFDWNRARAPLARRIAAVTGHAAAINGNLRVHLWSLTPSAEIDGLALKGTAGAEQPLLFSAAQIRISVSLARLLRGQIVVPELVLIRPVLNLERPPAAHGSGASALSGKAASLTRSNPPWAIPPIRRLSIRDGSLRVVDAMRHIRLEAQVTAGENDRDRDGDPLEVHARGTLNYKPFEFTAAGGPLLDLAPEKPYTFTAQIRAADIRIQTRITLRQPFNLRAVDATVSANGNDLADLYYLTALALPNTPRYRIAAEVHINGTLIRTDNIDGRVGASDVAGALAIDMARQRPQLTGRLTSRSLRLGDLAATLGQPLENTDSLAANEAKAKTSVFTVANASGAGNARIEAPTPRLLPDADLQVDRVRGMDADVMYTAGTVIAPKLPMKDVRLHLRLDDGRLTLDPVSMVLHDGRLAGAVQIDARADPPQTSIDLRLHNVRLSQFKSKSLAEPPFDGLLIGRLRMHGVGSSVHKAAATANGQITMLIPHGEISSALTALTEIDVPRGLGLLLAKDNSKTEIRCGVANFESTAGKLQAKTLFIDTTDVLISGQGSINLSDERLNLELQGNPKKLRLTRLRTPVTVKGTLSAPTIGIDAGKLAKQGAVATALGAVLTPFAAIVTFIDAGRAKNQDCAAAVSEGQRTAQR